MVKSRKSQKVKEQILELYRRKNGKRKIAQILGISKNTVKGVIRATELRPVDAEALNVTSTSWPERVRWDDVRGELDKKYVTIKCLHSEHAPDGIEYLRFWRELKRRFPESLEDKARIRFQYKPGVRVEIDYCDGILITDRITGAVKKTHLFAGVSSFSSYAFGEFVMNQKRDEFIRSQERMHSFFGGVFEYVIIDNLKSGVHKSHLYDPDLNPVYVDYANHAGFAVLPARPQTPRDKATVETTIGVIQRQFFAEVRNRVFYSLAELNACFREYLARLNSEVMKDHGVSRAARFEIEKPILRKLPEKAFETAEYRKVKVHPDCHVQVDKNFYSTPYRFIGQTLRARLTVKLIEIFNGDHETIAIHSRASGTGKFVTNDAHYPELKLASIRFDILHAKREAERVGPETKKLIDSLLDSNHPFRYLRRIQGILSLKKTYKPAVLEYACHQAMLFNRPRFSYINDCAKKFELSGHRPRVLGAPERDLSSVYLNNPENTENNL